VSTRPAPGLHPAEAPGLSLPDAERELAYSPSVCIGGDYVPWLRAYRLRSDAARLTTLQQGARWSEGRYGPAASQRLDLCLPPSSAAAGSPVPLLVYVHGGYWQELAAADSLFAAPACIARGMAFAALDYTLAPAAALPQIIAECHAALGWLAAHAEGLGIDPRQVRLAGSSAGAHLAALMCLPSVGDVPLPLRPQAALLVSGVYELEPLVGTSINQALGLDASLARRCSPAYRPLQQMPRCTLAWGEVETAAFKQQSVRFADALVRAGASVSTFEVPGRNHFDVVLDLVDAWL
jgi:arylformamidase